ncbi:hydrolase 1, exosortase A system-associated [Pseudoduganella sp. FT25W]|uniref:Hydrolase 1, exosortase A system-associated n=1 Tax=Duganella alba TaxID=2666081 RepID=A0A6L5QA08_9BURK|nr:hydrolase 1, exosortase A system-associated [Duganella alba]MRX06430.1 hydrolase 1, exosortase A system-associated [Duganella alba]MRX14824.1 hydrolase 1, exosortase A system-associated [Duganella alba]
MPSQRVLHFTCHDCWLFGILHVPDEPLTRGVLIVTGGPQYRIGSHRQFVLLARHLAEHSVPVMRFDYRGMGDSEGEMRDFESIQDDLEAAICEFFSAMPSLKELVLWGLCDGATAAAFHAPADPRVAGLVMLNPWVRTTQGEARTTLRHYYLQRMRDREFWRKLAHGRFGWRRALTSFGQVALAARQPSAQVQPLPERLYQSLQRFRGQVLIILSGADLGAREFMALARQHAHWRGLLASPRVRQAVIPHANHTFARKAWRDEVAEICTRWIQAW